VAAESAPAAAWEEGVFDLPCTLFHIWAILQFSRRFVAALLPSFISQKPPTAHVEPILGIM
jgi:hypothetical protein